MDLYRNFLSRSCPNFILIAFIITILTVGCGGGGGGGGGGDDDDHNTDDLVIFQDESTYVKDAEIVTLSISDKSVRAAKNQLLVHCELGIDNSQIKKIEDKLNELNCKVVGQIFNLAMIQIEIPIDKSYDEIADSLESLSGIRRVLPNIFISKDVSPIPNPGSEEWDDDDTYWIEHLNLRNAWNYLESLGLPIGNVTIGIVDSDYKFSISWSRDNDVIVWDSDGTEISSSNTQKDIGGTYDWHGTMVSNFAAGDGHPNSFDNEDPVGISWKSPLRIMQTEKTNNESQNDELNYARLAKCIDKLITKCPECKIINISRGVDRNLEDTNYLFNRQILRENLHETVSLAYDNNVLLVFSAGNRKINNDNEHYTNESIEDIGFWKSNAIIVGSSDSQFNRYDLSTTEGSVLGQVIDIIAPGEEVSMHPRMSSESGTSFSAPMVAGAAALVMTVRDDLSPADVKQILTSTSNNSLIDDWAGANIDGNAIGLLDVAEAIKESVFYNKIISISYPEEVESGADYQIEWNNIPYATSYCRIQSENSDLSGATPVCHQSRTQTYSHLVETDTTYFYKIIAWNEDLNIQLESEVISIVVKAEESGNGGIPDADYVNSIGMTFNFIPAGTFTMGSPDGVNEYPIGSGEIPDIEYIESVIDGETPHLVTLTKSFYMQTTEVTVGQWQVVMEGEAIDTSDPGNYYPKYYVSWDDAQFFISTLNSMGEGTYRLPSEAEWEYSARAGSSTAFHSGDITHYIDVFACNEDINLNDIGWYCFNSKDGDYNASSMQAVAQKQANAWGLYDMHGNLMEWCQDTSQSYPSGHVTDPVVYDGRGWYRIMRGGSYDVNAAECRSAIRRAHPPDRRHPEYGFRLVREP